MTNGIDTNVAICLAVYNGEEFIEDQIKSILQQSYKNWHLFVRDDRSTDASKSIIQEYIDRFPDKITDLSYLPGGGNSQDNFLTILSWVTANVNSDYFMFCDQDDVWLPNKIALCMDASPEIDSDPVLVHTDLRVVDEKLNILSDSFIKMSHLNPQKRDLAHLLVQNNVTGCTMFWNRALNRRFNPQDSSLMLMHDWWITLVAAGLGEIRYISTPTILYRQHQGNVVGAADVGSFQYIRSKLQNIPMIRRSIRDTFKQAKSFQDCYRKDLNSESNYVLDKYVNLSKQSKLRKIFACIKYNFLKQSFIQIIGQFVFI